MMVRSLLVRRWRKVPALRLGCQRSIWRPHLVDAGMLQSIAATIGTTGTSGMEQSNLPVGHEPSFIEAPCMITGGSRPRIERLKHAPLPLNSRRGSGENVVLVPDLALQPQCNVSTSYRSSSTSSVPRGPARRPSTTAVGTAPRELRRDLLPGPGRNRVCRRYTRGTRQDCDLTAQEQMAGVGAQRPGQSWPEARAVRARAQHR
jgi:hypothetical protein